MKFCSLICPSSCHSLRKCLELSPAFFLLLYDGWKLQLDLSKCLSDSTLLYARDKAEVKFTPADFPSHTRMWLLNFCSLAGRCYPIVALIKYVHLSTAVSCFFPLITKSSFGWEMFLDLTATSIFLLNFLAYGPLLEKFPPTSLQLFSHLMDWLRIPFASKQSLSRADSKCLQDPRVGGYSTRKGA